jgi:hypothetical protein
MDIVSFWSVVSMLAVLSIFVTVVAKMWRSGNIDLSGRHANMRGVYARSIAVGVLLAALLRANIIDILQNPGNPAVLLGWLSMPWAEYATLWEKAIGIIEEVVGVLVTGVILAFFSRMWNDVFDLLYQFQRWMKGKANATKPEEGSSSRPVPIVRRPRGARRSSSSAPRSESGGTGDRERGSDRGGERDRGGYRGRRSAGGEGR